MKHRFEEVDSEYDPEGPVNLEAQCEAEIAVAGDRMEMAMAMKVLRRDPEMFNNQLAARTPSRRRWTPRVGNFTSRTFMTKFSVLDSHTKPRCRGEKQRYG